MTKISMTIWVVITTTLLSLGATSPGVSMHKIGSIADAVGAFQKGEITYGKETKSENQPLTLEGANSRMAKKNDRQPGITKKTVECFLGASN